MTTVIVQRTREQTIAFLEKRNKRIAERKRVLKAMGAKTFEGIYIDDDNVLRSVYRA